MWKQHLTRRLKSKDRVNFFICHPSKFRPLPAYISPEAAAFLPSTCKVSVPSSMTSWGLTHQKKPDGRHVGFWSYYSYAQRASVREVLCKYVCSSHTVKRKVPWAWNPSQPPGFQYSTWGGASCLLPELLSLLLHLCPTQHLQPFLSLSRLFPTLLILGFFFFWWWWGSCHQ